MSKVTTEKMDKLEAWAKAGRRHFTVHYDDLMMRHPLIHVFDYDSVHGLTLSSDDSLENLSERIRADKDECLRREAGKYEKL